MRRSFAPAERKQLRSPPTAWVAGTAGAGAVGAAQPEMVHANPRHPHSAKRLYEAVATAHCIVIDYTWASLQIQPASHPKPKQATILRVLPYVAQMRSIE